MRNFTLTSLALLLFVATGDKSYASDEIGQSLGIEESSEMEGDGGVAIHSPNIDSICGETISTISEDKKNLYVAFDKFEAVNADPDNNDSKGVKSRCVIRFKYDVSEGYQMRVSELSLIGSRSVAPGGGVSFYVSTSELHGRTVRFTNDTDGILVNSFDIPLIDSEKPGWTECGAIDGDGFRIYIRAIARGLDSSLTLRFFGVEDHSFRQPGLYVTLSSRKCEV